jgi:hypothetical protein
LTSIVIDHLSRAFQSISITAGPSQPLMLTVWIAVASIAMAG